VFDAPIASFKHKIDIALKSTVGGLVAGAAALVALGFFCAALFLWLDERYGAIAAALVLGGVFVLIALIAVLVVVIVRRRRLPPAARKSWWADPSLLAAALSAGSRTLGRKQITLAVLAGAFVLGMLLNRPPRAPDDDQNG
jgi:hypothetical protein